MISQANSRVLDAPILVKMSQSLSEAQVQLLLQYLFSERADIRREAICNVGEQRWYHADVVHALEELAVLDNVAEVRAAACEALQILRCGDTTRA